MSDSDTNDKKEKKDTNKNFLKYFGIAIGVIILVIVIILIVSYMNRNKIPKVNNNVQSKVINNSVRAKRDRTDISDILTNFSFI